MLTREQAIKLAKIQAREFLRTRPQQATPLVYTYLVGVESEDWLPHEWVVDAILMAANNKIAVAMLTQEK